MSELSELFDRDPLQLSDQDITKIIQRMREAQNQYLLTPQKPAPKPKTNKTLDLLKDLGLT